jgi:hypothetical protein
VTDPDAPRLLARGGGYTSHAAGALRGAGEAVGPHALAGYGRAASRVEQARYDEILERRRGMPELDRLRLALCDAAVRRVDVSRELRLIRLRIDALERRIYRPVDRLGRNAA